MDACFADPAAIMRPKWTMLILLFVLLDVVEAKGEDFDDDLKEDFGPIVLTVIADRTQFLFLHDFAVL